MAKQKKKRNKPYRGSDAANARPTITRVQAVNRSKAGQWWFDRKRWLRPLITAIIVILLLVWLTVEFFSLNS